jgi:two-component system NtrC family sensor kinase
VTPVPEKRSVRRRRLMLRHGRMRPIAFRLMSGFLLVIVIISVVFGVVGTRLIGARIEAEAHANLRRDLNTAREIYGTNLASILHSVRAAADRFYLNEALQAGDLNGITTELARTRMNEELDVLTVTDESGVVLIRAANAGVVGDEQHADELVRAVIEQREPVAATSLIPAEELRLESPLLAERAHIQFVETPRARERTETEETAGMMLKAAAPVFAPDQRLIGIVYGGVLLNHRSEIVDQIKQTVFADSQYKGKDIGAATIFQDDVRISTTVRNQDDRRAIGTHVTEDVYDRVIREGGPWIVRDYVVSDWYLSAYEPIRNIGGDIIGILHAGILEEPYRDIQRRSTMIFVLIALIGAALAIALSYFISRKISIPIKQLVSASREVASGNLDAKVTIRSDRELADLADAFNSMASAWRTRDEKVKEFAKKRIMESERLAIVGQLAADVAHEINNPLQGIVTYSHMLLEKVEPDTPMGDKINKIAHQASRCTNIIRGLLDFSRQRKPHKRSARVKPVLHECVSLVENQALFHNIEIVKHFDEELPKVVIDPSQVEQVFMNMIINAAEAMDGNGRLTLTTRYDRFENAVQVDFGDTGHGISEENMERIFDPFFTTKEVGHGTGLGLAISFGIVMEHNGSISVESEVGVGTTFTVRFPVNADEGSAKNE